MFEVLNEKIGKLKKDNKGSAIVLVIVALAMVGILAMTIMWMSMTNFYMKTTDKGNKQGFYTSETVLEQIKAGLEEDASWAAARAYAYILTKDYSATSTADRDYDFKKAYIDYFVERVYDSSDASKGKYSIDHLLSFVDSAAGVKKTRTGKIRYLSSKETDGTEGECKFIHSYSSDLMKLQAVYLEYTDTGRDGGDYVSIINTDIVIMVPDVSFTQTSVLPDVFEYAIVADKKLTNTNSGTGTVINGNVYAGDDGIDLRNKLTFKYPRQISGRLVSKGDVRIGMDSMSISGTELSIDESVEGGMTEFWANDITLGKGTKLTTNKVDTYVADDLTLSGRKAKVTMKGHGDYYGYGNSDSVSGESSAIVVNGLGSQVDIKELDKVMLLGRTFVSIPNYTSMPGGGVSLNSIDFAMGESLAVKGEQVAFLVPDECLSYVDLNSVNNNAIRMPNPFVKTEYETDTNGDTVADHEIKVNLSSLSAYLDMANGYKIVYPYGSQLGYVYMQMSGEKANEYYEAYYKDNLEKLNNYFLVYAGEGKVELPAGSKVSSEGNFLTALYTDPLESAPDKIIKNDKSQLYTAIPEADKAYINSDLVLKKKNLCAKLIKDGATATELSNTLFDNLILKDDVDFLLDSTYTPNSNPYVFTTTDGNNYKAVFAKSSLGSPYVYDSSDGNKTRILVVIGDVTVKADFTGLLIASGTVTIDDGCSVITSIVNVTNDSDIQSLKDALQVKQTVQYRNNTTTPPTITTEERSALQYFVDGSAYDLDGLQRSASTTVSKNNVEFTELVKFNNWIKK